MKNIRDDYIKKFGNKYLDRFKKNLELLDKNSIYDKKVSIKSSYSNIIVWRNEFSHAGKIPSTATYVEVTKAYSNGKAVIDCLFETMQR